MPTEGALRSRKRKAKEQQSPIHSHNGNGNNTGACGDLEMAFECSTDNQELPPNKKFDISPDADSPTVSNSVNSDDDGSGNKFNSIQLNMKKVNVEVKSEVVEPTEDYTHALSEAFIKDIKSETYIPTSDATPTVCDALDIKRELPSPTFDDIAPKIEQNEDFITNVKSEALPNEPGATTSHATVNDANGVDIPLGVLVDSNKSLFQDTSNSNCLSLPKVEIDIDTVRPQCSSSFETETSFLPVSFDNSQSMQPNGSNSHSSSSHDVGAEKEWAAYRSAWQNYHRVCESPVENSDGDELAPLHRLVPQAFSPRFDRQHHHDGTNVVRPFTKRSGAERALGEYRFYHQQMLNNGQPKFMMTGAADFQELALKSSQVSAEGKGVESQSGLRTFKCKMCGKEKQFFFRLNFPVTDQKVEISYKCKLCVSLASYRDKVLNSYQAKSHRKKDVRAYSRQKNAAKDSQR